MVKFESLQVFLALMISCHWNSNSISVLISQVRAQHWNRETVERTSTARCRRAEVARPLLGPWWSLVMDHPSDGWDPPSGVMVDPYYQ